MPPSDPHGVKYEARKSAPYGRAASSRSLERASLAGFSGRQQPGSAQPVAQRVELAAVTRAARGIPAQRLAHLGRADREYRPARLVEVQAGGIERDIAEIQQPADLRLRIRLEPL